MILLIKCVIVVCISVVRNIHAAQLFIDIVNFYLVLC